MIYKFAVHSVGSMIIEYLAIVDITESTGIGRLECLHACCIGFCDIRSTIDLAVHAHKHSTAH